MKKILLVVLSLCLFATMVSAQTFIGAREAGMGGCGVSSAFGLTSVAYNPAGLINSGMGEFTLSLGGASQNIDQIINAVGAATDPATFLVNNLNTNLEANGSLFGLLGFCFNKVGLSVILPSMTAALNKPSGTIAGSATITGRYDVALTLGTTVPVPGLGGVDLGTNLKYIGFGYGNVNAAGQTLPFTASQTYGVGSGTGLDIGARTNIAIPFLSSFAVGIAMRDIGAKATVAEPKSRNVTFNADSTITEGAETTGASQDYTFPTTTAIGCSGTVPGMGLMVAADIESISGGTGMVANNETVTHLGLEMPIIANTLIGRAGLATGQNVSRTTLGAAVNIPFLNVQAAMVIDGKNSKNLSFVVDAGATF
ncbi:MAG: hypothetical protein KKB81_02955 [Candidatus Margulisbacteria bacterium]|nr:hypothetical protein [Candidatus Margulisiibacteriota bacterium]MBU1022203.1 hypothetical protein [Candidatus Margulisiibacteriota bacterium]MBU1729358.1 hypothetical protein [Candidatus Margulisiibacteriota bacterium]MBU1955631.1 hypothetical protein [Candidatus Margulisiibacteriota bacterium]